MCSRAKSDYAADRCQQLACPCVDAHVTDLLLAAMAPAALEVSLAAATHVEAQREQVDQIWRQRLERAGYQAERARRQYQLAEPENRLVVRQLEKDWEAALAGRQRLGEEYDRFTAARPRMLYRRRARQIRALAADLPAYGDVDHHRCGPQAADPAPGRAGPHHRPRDQREGGRGGRLGGRAPHRRADHPPGGLPDPAQLLPSARRPGPGELAGSRYTIAQIAGRLNAEGFRPPKRSPVFTPNAVSDLLRALGIHRSRIPADRNRPALDQHEWWLRDLAAHLGMPEVTLDHWVRRGWATGYLHPQARLRVVRADPAEVKRLRALHQVPRGQHNRRPWPG